MPAREILAIFITLAQDLAILHRAGASYYSLDEVRIVHLDAQGPRPRSSCTATSSPTSARSRSPVTPCGSSYGRWLTGTGNYHIRKLDPETGARLGSFAAPRGIVEIDVHGDELRLSNQWGEIIALDLETGHEEWRWLGSVFGNLGTQRGIASTGDGWLWIASFITSHHQPDPRARRRR